MTKSEACTRGIRVQVQSRPLPDRSDPGNSQWLFTYTITITNEGDEPVQLVSRHWIITDANGRREEVRGSGVVGQQPILSPGETFRYSSFCPLKTAFGSMQGTFQMLGRGGATFDATIAAFRLAEPHAIN